MTKYTIHVADVRSLMTDGGRGRYDLDPARVTGIAIHHSVTFFPAVTSRADEVHHLRMIDQYHASKGWGGFGYHLATFPSGRAYLCGSLTGARAHVASLNDRYVGLVLIGDFTSVGPGDTQIAAASEAVAYIRGHYPRRPIGGHRDFALPAYPTACPGDTYQQWLARLNTPVQQEEDMDEATVRAIFADEHARAHAGAPPGQRTYTVLPGDSPWRIAQKVWGDGSRYPEIQRANGLDDESTIHPGDVLVIP